MLSTQGLSLGVLPFPLNFPLPFPPVALALRMGGLQAVQVPFLFQFSTWSLGPSLSLASQSQVTGSLATSFPSPYF
jgi:hypothetical protein